MEWPVQRDSAGARRSPEAESGVSREPGVKFPLGAKLVARVAVSVICKFIRVVSAVGIEPTT